MNPSTTFNYFSEFALKQAFEVAIKNSLAKGEITLIESLWLRKASLENVQSRTVLPRPLYVSHIEISSQGTRSAYVRGALILSREQTPSTPFFLYTLTEGVQRVDDWAALEVLARNNLLNEQSLFSLLLPLDLRAKFAGGSGFIIEALVINGAVFKLLSEKYLASQSGDQYISMTVLSQLPSIRTVAGEQLDARLQRIADNKPAQTCSKSELSSELLPKRAMVDWVFEYHMTHTFWEGKAFEYRPATSCGVRVAKSKSVIELEFVRFIDEVSQQIDVKFKERIEQCWDVSEAVFPSLKQCVRSALRQHFMNELLQGRHSGSVSDQDYKKLCDRVQGYDLTQVEVARLTIRQTLYLTAELVGWYCFFMGGEGGYVYVIGDRGLAGYNNFYSFQSKVSSRFESILPSGILSSPPVYEQHLSRYLVIEEKEALLPDASLKIGYEFVSGDIFAVVEAQALNKIGRDIDYLSGWLKRGGVAADSYTAADYASVIQAVMDDTLDIRWLLGAELQTEYEHYRWSSRFSKGETIGETSGALLEQVKVPLNSILTHVDFLEKSVADLLLTFPTLKEYCKERLIAYWNNTEISAITPDSQLIMAGSEQGTSSFRFPPRTLVDIVLEHVTGHRSLPQDSAYLSFEKVEVSELNTIRIDNREGAAVHSLIWAVSVGFISDFEQKIRTYYRAGRHVGALVADKLIALKVDVMRAGSYYFSNYDRGISARDASCIEVVLGFRKREKRPSYHYFIPDVHRVVLYSKEINLTEPLVNCYLITERGGLESDCCGRVIFWSPVRKFESFKSLDLCQATLKSRLLHTSDYVELTDNINTAVRDRVVSMKAVLKKSTESIFVFYPVEEDFMSALNNDLIEQEIRSVKDAYSQGVVAGLSSETFQVSMDSYIERLGASFNVPALRLEVQTALFENSLPPLLSQATLAEKVDYAHILERYRNSVGDGRDYMNGIANIDQYALMLLKEQLAIDFPPEKLDPDDINVIVTQTLTPGWSGEIAVIGGAMSHQTQLLKSYVLSGYSQLQGSLSFKTINGKALPSAFNAAYVKSLVRKLDIGAKYRALLGDTLTLGTAAGNERFKLFCLQLPPQVLEIAFRKKLSGELSEKAYRSIECVMNMPDEKVRIPLEGTRIIMRALQVVSSVDADPDLVKGIYLIGPELSETGPLVMWVAYSNEFSFVEYADEYSFISDLLSREKLQAQVLRRMEPSARKKYEHGGFKEPHIIYIGEDFFSFDIYTTPAPVTISKKALPGNGLLTLYRDNYTLLLDMAKQQSVTTAEADWESFKKLLKLVGAAVVDFGMFLPAKLSVPLLVGQTLATAVSAIKDIDQGQPRDAIADFLNLLLLSIGNYHAAAAKRKVEGGSYHVPATHELKESAELLNAVHYNEVDHSLALDHYIERFVSVSDLTYAPETGIYRDERTDSSFVVLSGKVFRVKPDGGRLRIDIGEGGAGPAVKLDSLKQWSIDTYEPLLGGGPGFSHPVDMNASSEVTVLARGITEIRSLYPYQATVIQEAHALSVRYLETALETLAQLKVSSATNNPTVFSFWLQRFLGVVRLTTMDVEKIKKTVDLVYQRLLKPSMNPATSNRYVMCLPRDNNMQKLAFVNTSDARKYIYLNLGFFRTFLDPLNTGKMSGLLETIPPFEFNNHFRAVTLIHEVLHQVVGAHDLAYLDAAMPFHELLADSNVFVHGSSGNLQAMQSSALSLTTPRHLLFMKQGAVQSGISLSGTDIEFVLKTTGASTLAQARDVFINDADKRVEIILSNADSMALIISRLGGSIDRYQIRP